MTVRILYRLMGITLLVLSPYFVHAQLIDPVSFSLYPEVWPEDGDSDEVAFVRIRAEIDEGWYLYSIHNAPDLGPLPTRFSSVAKSLSIVGDVVESDAREKLDPNFGEILGLHADSADFLLPVVVYSEPEGKEFTLAVDVKYQACDDISCLPPVIKRVESVLSSSKIIWQDSDTPVEDHGYGTADFNQSGYGSVEVEEPENTAISGEVWPVVVALSGFLILGYFLIQKRRVSG